MYSLRVGSEAGLLLSCFSLMLPSMLGSGAPSMAARAAPPRRLWQACNRFVCLPSDRVSFTEHGIGTCSFSAILFGAQSFVHRSLVLPTLPSVCPLENARRALDRSGCVAGVASYVIHLCCKRIAPASDHMTAHSCYCAAGGPSSEGVHVLASGGIRSWAPSLLFLSHVAVHARIGGPEHGG